MTARSIVAPLFALTALFATAASAEGHGHARFACHEDVKAFCGDVKISEGREGIQACLKLHESQLSDACKTQRAEVKAHIEAFKAACGHDVETMCPAAKTSDEPRFEAIHECLRAHKADLSDSCKTFRQQMRSRFHRPGADESEPAATEGVKQ